jgi:hypothetical protein
MGFVNCARFPSVSDAYPAQFGHRGCGSDHKRPPTLPHRPSRPPSSKDTTARWRGPKQI